MPTLAELTSQPVPEEKVKKKRTIWSVSEAIAHLRQYPPDDLVVSMVVVPRKKEPDDAA